MFNLGGGEGSMLLMLCSNIVICTMVSCFVHELIFMIFINVLQKFEDTKGVIGSRKSKIRVITKLPNSEQSYKGKVKSHKYINRQNQSTTGKGQTATVEGYSRIPSSALI